MLEGVTVLLTEAEAVTVELEEVDLVCFLTAILLLLLVAGF